MTVSKIDKSTEVAAETGNTFKLDGTKALINFTSAFGGWGLASSLSAARATVADAGHLAAVNATFIKAMQPEPMELQTTVLRSGRRASFLRTELRATKSQALLLACDFVFADRKEPDIEAIRAFPDVLDFDDSPILPSSPGPVWLKDFEQRIGAGKPFSKQDKPNSAFWFKDPSGRSWDEKAILLVSDTPMPRTFFVDPMPRFGATVSYSFHMFASAEELANLGDAPVLIEADSDAVSQGRFTQSTFIWSQDRKLLAVSNQLAFY